MSPEIQDYLNQRTLTPELLKWAGSRIYDDRIEYVCYDEYGNDLGVIERRFTGTARFVVSLNTSDALYLVHRTLPHIFVQNEAVIVEGPADALALYQAGIQNVVALGGASNFGKRKLRLLRRYCDNLWFIFDKDSAGLKFFKSVKERQDFAVKTSITFTPREKDPAAFLANGGTIQEFRKLAL